MTVLKMESVTKTYRRRGKETCALDNVTLSIARGEFVAVVGPSGSGKSTLLLMLGGMLSPVSGRVLVDGVSLYDLGTEERATLRRKNIGFVFQTFNLIPYLTASENVQVPLMLAGLAGNGKAERAAELLGRLGLGDRLDHKPSELSVGQQQRVALARVQANDPPVILADEPTGNLDPETGRAVLAFLEEVNRDGRTIVMVTHDMRAAEKSKRIIKLVEGRVQSDESQGAKPLSS